MAWVVDDTSSRRRYHWYFRLNLSSLIETQSLMQETWHSTFLNKVPTTPSLLCIPYARFSAVAALCASMHDAFSHVAIPVHKPCLTDISIMSMSKVDTSRMILCKWCQGSLQYNGANRKGQENLRRDSCRKSSIFSSSAQAIYARCAADFTMLTQTGLVADGACNNLT